MTIEGLSAPLLGTFGSNTARTLVLDRLAADGIVLDQCTVDSTSFEDQFTSLFTGLHQIQRRHRTTGPITSDSPPSWSLWNASSAAGIPNCFITDCPVAARLAEKAGCTDVYVVPVEKSVSPAEQIDECTAIELFVVASELLAERGGLVWVHSAGMRLPWDAPLAERNACVDPEDPSPPEGVGPPWISDSEAMDPDIVVGWGQVAAAQAAVFDGCLATLQSALSLREDQRTWANFAIFLRGVPLGEHGRVGRPEHTEMDANAGLPEDVRLHGEEVHVPSIIVPRKSGSLVASDSLPAPGTRRSELFQLPDLGWTIAGSLGLAVRDSHKVWGRNIFELPPGDTPNRWNREFQLAAIESETDIWIRCPAWNARLDKSDNVETGTSQEEMFKIESVQDDGSRTALFVKPEDRWEVNDIADRREDIVRLLLEYFHHFIESAARDSREWPELPTELINLIR